MIRSNAHRIAIAIAAFILASAGVLAGVSVLDPLDEKPPDPPRPERAPAPDPHDIEGLARRIGEVIAKACPPADAADSVARDAAAKALAREVELIDSIDGSIGWGAADASSASPAGNHLTRLAPLVFAKVYLSLFSVQGTPTVHSANGSVTLDIPVKFRSGLRPTEYPEPIWQTAEWWNSYAATTFLSLVFHEDVMVNALRHAPLPAPASGPIEENRVKMIRALSPAPLRGASFEYLLSPENPDMSGLSGYYQQLLKHFETQGCVACHAPAPSGTAVILTQPIQALAASHVLAKVLQDAENPGPKVSVCPSPTVRDPAALKDMRRLADEFANLSDGVQSFESARRALHQ